jgi:hypothetical protein
VRLLLLFEIVHRSINQTSRRLLGRTGHRHNYSSISDENKYERALVSTHSPSRATTLIPVRELEMGALGSPVGTPKMSLSRADSTASRDIAFDK